MHLLLTYDVPLYQTILPGAMYAPSPGDVKDIFRSLVTLALCRY
jgi:hypothetical protein